MELTDEELLEQYVSGQTEALAELLERYRRPLFSFILRMVPSSADADEVFQEVWMRVIRKAADSRRDRFKGWVFRIAHNLLIDRARSRRPMASLDEPIGGDTEQTLAERVPSGGVAPNMAVEGRDLGRRIQAALAMLPPEQRQVFLLRTEGDVPFKDIARLQRVSINTALARMQYALAKMRQLLEEDYESWRKT